MMAMRYAHHAPSEPRTLDGCVTFSCERCTARASAPEGDLAGYEALKALDEFPCALVRLDDQRRPHPVLAALAV
jgi:hypothetical protein